MFSPAIKKSLTVAAAGAVWASTATTAFAEEKRTKKQNGTNGLRQCSSVSMTSLNHKLSLLNHLPSWRSTFTLPKSALMIPWRKERLEKIR
ncbi:hypothetical protein RMATCC62417_13797 [Rhizopus microsporus]|nr:hypothetical protein RMATCC62417_13797 [Rhizopus microsporus]